MTILSRSRRIAGGKERLHECPTVSCWSAGILARQKGAGLIYVVVGLQLMAILSMVTTPIVAQTLQLYALRGAARGVMADLQRARMGAVMENHHYRFVIVDSDTYKLHDDTNNNDTIDAGETVTTRNIQTDCPGIQLATGAAAIVFAADGTASSTGTVTVSTTTLPSTSANVVVSSAGRVRIS
jgi:Tfp pilus assembly protein FimT